jgi:hypothetical protein
MLRIRRELDVLILTQASIHKEDGIATKETIKPLKEQCHGILKDFTLQLGHIAPRRESGTLA